MYQTYRPLLDALVMRGADAQAIEEPPKRPNAPAGRSATS